jgi:hypothetical protein
MENPLPFLDKIIAFPEGASYQRLEPITDFRQCHGVTPPERRILFRCRRVAAASPEEPSPKNGPSNEKNNNNNNETEDEEYILKIKVQIPNDTNTTANNSSQTSTTSTSIPPPSVPTAHELRALTTFRDSQTPFAPRLIAFSHVPQNSAGPLPQKGHVSSTVMSKIAGKSLFELGYWSMRNEEREEIQRGFLGALG